MPTRKISDEPIWAGALCRDPEHNPPTMRVFTPGLWEHVCPNCGKTQMFYVPKVRLCGI